MQSQAFSLIMGVWAQDGPNSQGSQTVARPRKGCRRRRQRRHTPRPDSDLPKIPSKLSPKATKGNDATADATFKAETNVVNVDVQVIDNNGNPIPNIPRDRFRILEDNVPQTLTQFSVGEAPMTVAIVIEFSAPLSGVLQQRMVPDDAPLPTDFVQTLKPDDYVAVIAYDLRTTILSDFTNDRAKTMEAMQRLRIPGFAESNMFDALARHSRPHVEDRRAQGDPADRFGHRHFQQAHLRQGAQELCRNRACPSIRSRCCRCSASWRRQDGRIAGTRVSAGRQRIEDVRERDRRPGVFPALSGRTARCFPVDLAVAAHPVFIGLFAEQPVEGWQVPEDHGAACESGHERAAAHVDEKGKPIKYTILAKAGYTAPRAVE